MGDFIKTRFADGVIAEVIKFNVEVLLPGIMENEQKCYADRRIMEDRRNGDLGRWNHTYIFPSSPKSKIILGSDSISSETVLVPAHPTYRYSLHCVCSDKCIEIIWYDDAPPIYTGIYDVFQKITEQVEFNRYSEEWI